MHNKLPLVYPRDYFSIAAKTETKYVIVCKRVYASDQTCSFFLPHVFYYILFPMVTLLADNLFNSKSNYEKYSVYHLTEQ